MTSHRVLASGQTRPPRFRPVQPRTIVNLRNRLNTPVLYGPSIAPIRAAPTRC